MFGCVTAQIPELKWKSLYGMFYPTEHTVTIFFHELAPPETLSQQGQNSLTSIESGARKENLGESNI